MKEIEIKILDVNPTEIRKKLAVLGAKKTFDGDVEIVMFDFPDGRLKKNDCLLRVRRLGDKTEVCYKGKNESKTFKVKEEIEIVADDFENALKIFERLGFKRTYEGKKHREAYHLNDTKFEMDTYAHIPTYLEIDAPDEKSVEKYVKKLGYTMQQTSNMSAYQLAEFYKKVGGHARK